MSLIKKFQKRLPDPVLFSKLEEKSASLNISAIDLKKARNGNLECLFAIANKCYIDHWYEGTLILALKLSKTNHAESQRIMGELFERGHLGFKNKTYAFQWYKVAAENGSIIALEHLREGYTGRKKVTKIRKLEMKCYTQAAVSRNNKEAQFMLGTFFENGIGVDVDKEFASIWYSKSALQGYKPAIGKAKELEKKGYTFILISPVTGTVLDTVVDATVVNEQPLNKREENKNNIGNHGGVNITDNSKTKQISIQEYQTLLEKLDQIESKMSSFSFSQNESNNNSGSEVYFDAKDDLLQELYKKTEQIESLLVNDIL